MAFDVELIQCVAPAQQSCPNCRYSSIFFLREGLERPVGGSQDVAVANALLEFKMTHAHARDLVLKGPHHPWAGQLAAVVFRIGCACDFVCAIRADHAIVADDMRSTIGWQSAGRRRQAHLYTTGAALRSTTVEVFEAEGLLEVLEDVRRACSRRR